MGNVLSSPGPTGAGYHENTANGVLTRAHFWLSTDSNTQLESHIILVERYRFYNKQNYARVKAPFATFSWGPVAASTGDKNLVPK